MHQLGTQKSKIILIFLSTGDDGKPMLGHRKLIKGEKSFFLKPGEELEDGIQDMYVLGDDEGIVLRALEVSRQPKC